MSSEGRFMVDVGLADLRLPMVVASRDDPDGQNTIAKIAISAHIMHEFEAGWIDTFIRLIHQHRGHIGTSTLKTNIGAYLDQLRAKNVRIDIAYPFFVEKRCPVSEERNLVGYDCIHSVKAFCSEPPTVLFGITVPIITTDPASLGSEAGELFGQLSNVRVEVKPTDDVFPEDLVALVDRHALVPVHSFLTDADKEHAIQRVRTVTKSSVVVVDEIREELARSPDIEWFAVRCANSSLLHTYGTMVGTEQNSWVPFSTYARELDEEAGLTSR
jgi:GTP cyclohydrolase IB